MEARCAVWKEKNLAQQKDSVRLGSGHVVADSTCRVINQSARFPHQNLRLSPIPLVPGRRISSCRSRRHTLSSWENFSRSSLDGAACPRTSYASVACEVVRSSRYGTLVPECFTLVLLSPVPEGDVERKFNTHRHTSWLRYCSRGFTWFTRTRTASRHCHETATPHLVHCQMFAS